MVGFEVPDFMMEAAPVGDLLIGFAHFKVNLISSL
jgi:hypothetical protein